MAIQGVGIDLTMKAEASLRTTTSQYKVVGMIGATTGVADFTVENCGATATGAAAMTVSALGAIGINQTYLSSNADTCKVRFIGFSKAVCGGSISAGDFVRANTECTNTALIGTIVTVANGASCSIATTSITAQVCVLGRALEKGSTGTVITIMLNPQLYDLNLIK